MDHLRYLPLLSLAIAANLSAQETNTRLEEVVVNAQKRTQVLQDVPISVSAVSGEDMRASAITDVYDLQQSVPGLVANQNQTAVTSTFSIRGVGTNGNNFGLESSVGLYVDGVYRSRPSSLINNMLDMEAVEVLRGPQGTLFGRNTPSGALLMRSAAPTDSVEGFFEVNAGSYNLAEASAAISGPLTESVSSRLSLYGGTRDGYVSDVGNFALGDDVINDRDRFGGRLQFLYEPHENLSVRVIGDYSEIDEVCCAALNFLGNFQALERPEVNGSDALIMALGGTVVPDSNFFDYQVALNQLPTSQNEDSGVSAEINWDIDGVTLTSITAFREFDSFDSLDADFTDLAILSQTRDARQDAFSQELRLAFSGDRYTAIVGAYYYNQDLYNEDILTPEAQFVNFITSRPDLGALIAGLNQASQASGGFIPAPAAFANPSLGSVNQMQQDHRSLAFFGQVDFELAPEFIVTIGARYTEENKELRGRFTQDVTGEVPDITAAATQLMLAQAGSPEFNPLALQVFAQPFASENWGYYLFDTLSPRPNVNESIDDDQVTGTFKLSWIPSNNALFYASYSTGYKAGGTNTDRINSAFDYVFGPETSESVEVGAKTEFPEQNLRLNVALHQTRYEDFQSNSFTGLGFNLQNAGEIDTYGGELEVLWRPGDNTDITLAYAYSVAEYDSYEQGTCWVATPFHTNRPDPGQTDTNGDNIPDSAVCDRSGGTLPNNPENFATFAIAHTISLGDKVSLFGKIETVYYDETISEENNDPLKVQDAYNLVNARLALNFDGPNVEIALWGRNITDEEYYGSVADAPTQDGRLIAYAREPASFGVSLRKSF